MYFIDEKICSDATKIFNLHEVPRTIPEMYGIDQSCFVITEVSKTFLIFTYCAKKLFQFHHSDRRGIGPW